MEIWDIFDENGANIGTRNKGDYSVKKGEYRLETDIWIVNEENEILMFVRAADKMYSGLFDCIHSEVSAGDSSIVSAKNALIKQLLKDFDERNIECVFRIRDDLTNVFYDVCVVSIKKELLEKELEENNCEWLTFDDLEELCAKRQIISGTKRRFLKCRDLINYTELEEDLELSNNFEIDNNEYLVQFYESDTVEEDWIEDITVLVKCKNNWLVYKDFDEDKYKLLTVSRQKYINDEIEENINEEDIWVEDTCAEDIDQNCLTCEEISVIDTEESVIELKKWLEDRENNEEYEREEDAIIVECTEKFDHSEQVQQEINEEIVNDAECEYGKSKKKISIKSYIEKVINKVKQTENGESIPETKKKVLIWKKSAYETAKDIIYLNIGTEYNTLEEISAYSKEMDGSRIYGMLYFASVDSIPDYLNEEGVFEVEKITEDMLTTEDFLLFKKAKKYVNNKMSDGCDFCNITNDNTWKADVVFKDEDITCFLDADPINEGHVVIVPNEHYVDLDDMPDDVAKKMIVVTKRVVKTLKLLYQPDGYTVMQNGGSFNDGSHFHIHAFPRYSDDDFRYICSDEHLDVSKESVDVIKRKIANVLEDDKLY